jgi:formylglycine-generating enzyme required for sulfatase activity
MRTGFASKIVGIYFLFEVVAFADIARAVVSVWNGALNIGTVTYGGSGYVTAPEVRVVGGGGTGGAVITVLDKGKVASVIVVNRGKNYSSVPTLEIDPPPSWLWTIPKIQMGGIDLIRVDGEPGNRCRIEWSSNLPPYDIWNLLTNVTIAPAGYSLVASKPADQQRYYRSAFAPPEGFVWVVPGAFLMGKSYNDPAADSKTEPSFSAIISKGFWICDHEVTQGEMFGQSINTVANNSMVKGVDLPVDNISWLKAYEYSWKVTDIERKNGRLPLGYKYSLPTEAQWEYCCRAGTTGPYAGIRSKLVYPSTRIQKVRLTSPNPWGLYEMHGNVSEWCLDSYSGGNKYKNSLAVFDPVGDLPPPPVGGVESFTGVIRGGAASCLPSWPSSSTKEYSYSRRGCTIDGGRGLRLVIVEE